MANRPVDMKTICIQNTIRIHSNIHGALIRTMTDVVSFRPSAEELDAIERVRKAHGFSTRAETIRYLVREGARQKRDWTEDPLYEFEIEGFVRPDEDLTSRDIDRGLYGAS